MSSRFYIRLGTEISDLRVCISYNGNGNLFIKSVQISENRLWRFTRVLLWGFVFLCLDFVYIFFGKRNLLGLDVRQKEIAFCLFLIVFAASITYFTDFLILPSFDQRFHLSRIASIAESIKDGILPQRIQFTANNGYGYASPLFYGEFFLYIPALLYCLWVPMGLCYQFYAVMMNILTCGISYWCFKRVSGSRKLGIAGACMYTLSAYRMIDMITRSAVGEYTAMTFLPLVCYGFWYIYTRDDDEKISLRECLPLILGLAGVIQSHLLTLLMCAFFIALFAAICFRRTFKKYRLAALVKSAAAVLALNLWFIVPMLESMLTLDVNIMDSAINIEKRGLYLVQIFGIFQSSSSINNVNNGMQEEMPLTLGFTLTLALVLWVFCIIRRQNMKAGRRYLREASVFGGFALVSVFLASNLLYSDILAANSDLFATVFGKIQFPWRFLSMATVFACFTAVLCLKTLLEEKEVSGRAVSVLAALMLVPGIVSLGLYTMQVMDSSKEVVYTSSPYITDSLYLPYGTNKNLLYSSEVLKGGGVTASEADYQDGVYSIWCENESSDDSYVTFPVLDYGHYHAYDSDSNEELEISTGENNRVRVTLPSGYEGTVVLKYEEPLFWRACELISVFSLVGGAVYLVRLCRKRRPL